LLAQERGQTELLPSDVEISADENGRPLVAVGSIRPAISISHADGIAIAAATVEPGTAIGVDVQRLDPSRDGFEDLAFDAQERSLLAIRDPEQRREYALRFWCAKEAAAKALGYGLLGGPGSVIVRSFNADDGSILLAATGSLAEQFARDEPLAVHTFRQKDLVIATCLHRISRGAYDPR
jgi:phosphopantetheinyl transferase